MGNQKTLCLTNCGTFSIEIISGSDSEANLRKDLSSIHFSSVPLSLE